MNLYLDSRTSKDRRDHDLAFPQTADCRANVERRTPKMPGDKLTDYNRVLADGYWGASEDDSTAE